MTVSRFIAISLRAVLPIFLAVFLGALSGAPARANDAREEGELTFFRIGNGGTSGTYYPIGGLVATAISKPPGATPCAQGGPCGVPGLLASAIASSGSVANVDAIAAGTLESGFAQADIAYWAQTGTGAFAGMPAVRDLRAIGRLYAEAMHLVTLENSGIRSVADLRGKRVSLDEPGSGTLVDARLVLDAAGMNDSDITPFHLPAAKAGAALRSGKIDAFFFVGGFPAPLVSQLSAQARIRLVPISEDLTTQLTSDHSFFTRDAFPAGAYPGVTEPVPTLSVGAIWVTSARQDPRLIYDITRVLWNDNTMRHLAYGHPTGRRIHRNEALNGVAIPLHEGAARYYRDAGLLK